MAKKSTRPKLDSRSAEGSPQMQQDLIEDAFPEKDDELEKLAQQFLSLEDKAKKAAEKKKEKLREIAIALKDRNLEAYKCYECRRELNRKVDDASMRVVPEKESTPYQPAA